MPITTTVLFDTPQHEVASKIVQLLNSSTEVSIVAGFLTEEGTALIADPIRRKPNVLRNLIVGAGTLRALEALDELIKLGVHQDRMHVHLGYSRHSSGKRSSFIQYHPMLHSKVYYFERENALASAIIGSHNVTGFALSGQNGEASVLLEGNRNEQAFADIRNHIDQSVQSSIPYNPLMKEAYSWWARQFAEGLQYKIYHEGGNRGEIENRKTIVVFSVPYNQSDMPRSGETIYLEVPEAFKILSSLNDPVHFYILPKLPSSPQEAVRHAPNCKVAYNASVIGTNMDRRVEEGKADWLIPDVRNPTFKRAPSPFKPAPHQDMIQVFLRLNESLQARYEYLFQYEKNKWEPVFDENKKIEVSPEHAKIFTNLKLIPPEHIPWMRVVDLHPVETDTKFSNEWKKAIKETAPEAGIYALYSRSRKKLQRY